MSKFAWGKMLTTKIFGSSTAHLAIVKEKHCMKFSNGNSIAHLFVLEGSVQLKVHGIDVGLSQNSNFSIQPTQEVVAFAESASTLLIVQLY